MSARTRRSSLAPFASSGRSLNLSMTSGRPLPIDVAPRSVSRGLSSFRSFSRARACPFAGAAVRRATYPPCRRTSPRCSGAHGTAGRSQTSSAQRPPPTVYHSLCPGARPSPPSFPGRFAKVTARETIRRGPHPGLRGAALLLKLLNFSCSRCSFPSDHSDHFLVNINIKNLNTCYRLNIALAHAVRMA